eukprot:4970887-Prymnesium_polylepis.1
MVSRARTERRSTVTLVSEVLASTAAASVSSAACEKARRWLASLSSRSASFVPSAPAMASMPTEEMEFDSRLSAVMVRLARSTSPHATPSSSTMAAFTISTATTAVLELNACTSASFSSALLRLHSTLPVSTYLASAATPLVGLPPGANDIDGPLMDATTSAALPFRPPTANDMAPTPPLANPSPPPPPPPPPPPLPTANDMAPAEPLLSGEPAVASSSSSATP